MSAPLWGSRNLGSVQGRKIWFRPPIWLKSTPLCPTKVIIRIASKHQFICENTHRCIKKQGHYPGKEGSGRAFQLALPDMSPLVIVNIHGPFGGPLSQPPPLLGHRDGRGRSGQGCATCRAVGGGGGGSTQDLWLKMIPTSRL